RLVAAALLGGPQTFSASRSSRMLLLFPCRNHADSQAWLRQGNSNSIRLDRLAEKVWGPPSKAAATNRKRRERIGKALDEISKLHGWNVKIEGRGVAAKATIKRPLLLEQS
ncbi:replication protein C, IncQ-type, partial [Aeromonas caviae]